MISLSIMTRFIGTSFKITPVYITGNGTALTDLSSVAKLLNNKIFGSGEIPDTGWLSLQSAKYREDIISEKIQISKLPDGFEVLPATGVRDALDAGLKTKLPPSVYLALSNSERYLLKPVDFIFFKEADLFCLISSIGSGYVNSAIGLLESSPFGNQGFTINKYPAQFNISPDLILWLLHVNYDIQKKISPDLTITDILRLDGVLKVPNSLQYSGASTPDHLIELKLSIAQKRTFTSVELILKHTSGIFQFSMNTDGCVELSSTNCEFCENESRNIRNLAKIIQIYKVIIPELKRHYTQDTVWFTSGRDAFIAKCSNDCANILQKTQSNE